MQLGNGIAEGSGNSGSDFALYSYDNSGTYIGNPLIITRATGNAYFANPLTCYSVITAGLPTGGKAKLNPGDAGHTGYVAFHNASDVRQAYFGYASDGTLFLQLEDATTNFLINANTVRLSEGRLISYGAGNSPSLAVYDNGTAVASGMWIESSGNLVWGDTDGSGNATGTRMWLDRGSNFWANGNGSIHAGGALVASGDVSAANRVYCNDMMNSTGTFYVAGNYNYYFQRSPGDGFWRFVEGGTTNFTVDTSGNAIARTSVFANNGIVQAGGGIYAFSGNAGIYWGGSGVVLQLAANWYFDWNGSNGNLAWMQNGTAQWIMHSDTSCYNNRNWVGGHGPYVDVSDERSKTGIIPATEGLDAVLAINPIRFKRIGEQFKREEIGFVRSNCAKCCPRQ